MASHDYDDLLQSFMNNSSKAYEDDINEINAKKEIEESSQTSHKTKSVKGKKGRQIEKELAKEKEQQKKTGNKRRNGKDINPFLKVIIGALIIIGVVGIVCFSVISIYGYSVVYGDPVFNLNEEKYNQNQTSFIYGTNSKGKSVEVARLYGEENRIWVDESKMSKYMSEAFIALEDKRFEKHGGVDWKRTIAVFARQNGQGGSTITQQLIKNLTDENQATYIRKFNEILSALNIEKNYSKDEIIEAYMNTVYLSNGCYGVKTAAEKYFGKDVSKLNIAECASIAAITKWPNHYDPLYEPENNRKRQLTCLQNMRDQGLITQKEYDDAVNYKMVFTNSKGYKGSTVKNSNKSSTSSSVNSYYTDYVIDSVLSDLQRMGYSSKTAKKMLYGGGLKIYSAVDFSIQKELESIYVNHKKMLDDKVQGACVVMDYKGRVVAMVGGTGKKTANRVLNRATSSKRQPGSTIKPISVYGPAIEKSLQDDNTDIYWSTVLSDSPFMKVDGKLWPHNAGGGYSGSNVSLQYGLAKSLNTIAVRTLNEIGTDYSYNFLTDNFHISTLDAADDDFAPLATGSLTNGVTPLEMTAAYATFGNGGYYYEPYCYYNIKNSQGEDIIKKDAEGTKKQALSTNSAWVMNKLLQTVLKEGTGTAFRLSGVEAYAKTGTTDDAKDLWFMAGTPSYVTGIWYGYDYPEAINYNYSSPCGQIWNYLMSQIYDGNSKLPTEFTVPDGVVQRKYCTSTGKLASSGCYSTAYGWFDEDNLPGYCSGGHGGGSSSSSSSSSSGSSSNNNSTTNNSNSSNSNNSTTSAATTSASTTAAKEDTQE